MLWTISVILLILWLWGIISGWTMGGAVNILLLMAIVVILIQVFLARRRLKSIESGQPLNPLLSSSTKIIIDVCCVLVGLLIYLWASRHSPYNPFGIMMAGGLENYFIKEPFYTVILLIAAGLGLLGISLLVLELISRAKLSKSKETNVIQPAPKSKRIFCTQCGKENDSNSAFCVHCGQRI